MNTDKPDTLSFSAQPLDWRGTLHQCFTAGLGFDLLTGKLVSADMAFAAAMQGLAPGDCMDMGVPKKQAEWLLAGNVYAPGGSFASGLSVDMRVGESFRRLLVAGNAPFTSMPLTWDKTWGTPEENPHGLASAQIRRAPVSDAALPFGAPACPGPMGAWPCRMKRMGTYDAAWLKSRWPGVPDDFDWSFFNLAQPVQRLPQGIRGDEVVELTNLHPLHPRLAATLPGKTLRLFLLRGGQWYENAVTADTVWLFPNQLVGIILWHGMTPCADESGSDIEGVRLVLEPEDAAPETPVSAAEAAAAEGGAVAAGVAAGAATAAAAAAAAESGERKSDSAQTSAESVSQEADGPGQTAQPVEKAASPASEASTENLKAELSSQLDESIGEINEALAAFGLPPMTEAQVAETRERLNSMADYVQAVEAEANKPQPALDDLLRQAGVSEESISAVNAALELEQPNPEDFGDAASWQAAVGAYVASFASLMHPSESVTENMRTVLNLKGPGGDALLKNMAGGSSPAPAELLAQAGMEPAAATRLLELLEGDIPSDLGELSKYAKTIEQASGFPEGSVSGRIDAFRDMLREAGIENVVPGEPVAAGATVAEQAQSASIPDGAGETSSVKADGRTPSSGAPSDRAGVILLLAGGGSLAGLTLAGMDLSELDLSGQDMTGTTLSGAKLAGSRLDGASLAGVDMTGADASGCSFAEADLSGANLSGVKAPEASFLRSRLEGANLSAIIAPDADFTGAALTGASLVGAALAGAVFNEIRADGLNASDADIGEARFRFCEMRNAVFDRANLAKADFHDAVLDSSAFRSANLDEATFCYGTRASGCIFSGASLKGGVWTNVHAPGCTFTGGKAAGASFTDCDFSAASWRGADVRNGDFSRCRLHGADMQGVNLFRGSLREAGLEGADLRGANLYGADLYRIGTDAGTNLTGADCSNTVLAARKEI